MESGKSNPKFFGKNNAILGVFVVFLLCAFMMVVAASPVAAGAQVDTTPPTIVIFSPLNQTYNTSDTLNYLDLTYYVNDSSEIYSVWSEYDGENSTLYENTTFYTLNDQVSTLTIWANDTLGNLAHESVTFTIHMNDITKFTLVENTFPDTIPPIVAGTPFIVHAQLYNKTYSWGYYSFNESLSNEPIDFSVYHFNESLEDFVLLYQTTSYTDNGGLAQLMWMPPANLSGQQISVSACSENHPDVDCVYGDFHFYDLSAFVDVEGEGTEFHDGSTATLRYHIRNLTTGALQEGLHVDAYVYNWTTFDFDYYDATNVSTGVYEVSVPVSAYFYECNSSEHKQPVYMLINGNPLWTSHHVLFAGKWWEDYPSLQPAGKSEPLEMPPQSRFTNRGFITGLAPAFGMSNHDARNPHSASNRTAIAARGASGVQPAIGSPLAPPSPNLPEILLTCSDEPFNTNLESNYWTHWPSCAGDHIKIWMSVYNNETEMGVSGARVNGTVYRYNESSGEYDELIHLIDTKYTDAYGLVTLTETPVEGGLFHAVVDVEYHNETKTEVMGLYIYDADFPYCTGHGQGEEEYGSLSMNASFDKDIGNDEYYNPGSTAHIEARVVDTYTGLPITTNNSEMTYDLEWYYADQWSEEEGYFYDYALVARGNLTMQHDGNWTADIPLPDAPGLYDLYIDFNNGTDYAYDLLLLGVREVQMNPVITMTHDIARVGDNYTVTFNLTNNTNSASLGSGKDVNFRMYCNWMPVGNWYETTNGSGMVTVSGTVGPDFGEYCFFTGLYNNNDTEFYSYNLGESFTSQGHTYSSYYDYGSDYYYGSFAGMLVRPFNITTVLDGTLYNAGDNATVNITVKNWNGTYIDLEEIKYVVFSCETYESYGMEYESCGDTLLISTMKRDASGRYTAKFEVPSRVSKMEVVPYYGALAFSGRYLYDYDGVYANVSENGTVHDLNLTFVNATPARLAEGEALQFLADVTNDGTVSESSVVHFKVDTRSTVSSTPTDTISAGSTMRVSGSWIASGVGTHLITACVDAVYNETHTSDNCRNVSYRVNVTARPTYYAVMFGHGDNRFRPVGYIRENTDGIDLFAYNIPETDHENITADLYNITGNSIPPLPAGNYDNGTAAWYDIESNTTLSDGLKYYNISFDVLGTVTSFMGHVIVDNTPPQIADIQASPTEFNNIGTPGRPRNTTLSATITDNNGITNVDFELYDSDQVMLVLDNATALHSGTHYAKTWTGTKYALVDGTDSEVNDTTITVNRGQQFMGNDLVEFIFANYSDDGTNFLGTIAAVVFNMSTHQFKSIYNISGNNAEEIVYTSGVSAIMPLYINTSKESDIPNMPPFEQGMNVYTLTDGSMPYLSEIPVSEGGYGACFKAIDVASNDQVMDCASVGINNAVFLQLQNYMYGLPYYGAFVNDTYYISAVIRSNLNAGTVNLTFSVNGTVKQVVPVDLSSWWYTEYGSGYHVYYKNLEWTPTFNGTNHLKVELENVTGDNISDNVYENNIDVHMPDLSAYAYVPYDALGGTNLTGSAYFYSSVRENNIRCRIYVQNESGGTVAVLYDGLKNISWSVYQSFSWTVPTGVDATYHIITQVDVDNNVTEENEDNNIYNSTVNVVSAVHIHTGTLYHPDSVTSGDSFSVCLQYSSNYRTPVNLTLGYPANNFELSGSWWNRNPNEGYAYRSDWNWMCFYPQAIKIGLRLPMNLTLSYYNGSSVVQLLESFNMNVMPKGVQLKDHQTGSAIVNPGVTTTLNKTLQVFNVPSELVSGTITLYGGAEGAMLRGLKYLLNYVYGCIEQRTSRQLANMFIMKYYANRGALDPALRDDVYGRSHSALLGSTNDGGIQSPQWFEGDMSGWSDPTRPNDGFGNGGWGWWPDQNYYTPTPFFTSIALYAISVTGTTGTENNTDFTDTNFTALVNQSRLNYGINWIIDRQLLNGTYNGSWDTAYPDYITERNIFAAFATTVLEEAYKASNNATGIRTNITGSVDNATKYLDALQNSDGGWGRDPGADSDAYTTGLVLIALNRSRTAVGLDTLNDTRIHRGAQWLLDNQQADGKWTISFGTWHSYGGSYEYQTTAYALMGLNSAGYPTSNGNISAGISYLVSSFNSYGGWGATKSTAAVVEAFVRLNTTLDTNVTARMWFDNCTNATGRVNGSREVEFDINTSCLTVGNHTVIVNMTGSGTVSYGMLITVWADRDAAVAAGYAWAIDPINPNWIINVTADDYTPMVGSNVTLNVNVNNTDNESLEFAMIKVTMPPGYSVTEYPADVGYEQHNGSLYFFLQNISNGSTYDLSYKISPSVISNATISTWIGPMYNPELVSNPSNITLSSWSPTDVAVGAIVVQSDDGGSGYYTTHSVSTILANISNDGSSNISLLEAQLRIDGVLVDVQSRALDTGEAWQYNYAWSADAGSHTIELRVPAVTGETSTANNEQEESIEVYSGLYADFAVTELNVSPTSVEPGDSVSINYTVKNIGIVDMQGSVATIKLRIGDVYINATNLTTFNVNDTFTGELVWSTSTEGTYNVSVFVDEDGLETELNEDNNLDYQSVTVASAPSGCTNCGGAGGGGGGAGAAPAANRETATFQKVEIGAENTFIAKMFLGVTGITFVSKNVRSNVFLSVERLDGEPANLSSEPVGDVFLFLKISLANIGTSDLQSATIDFKVNKSWIDANSIDPASIKLYRYVGSEWVALDTALSSSDSEFYYYSASTPGFSYFAIAGMKEEAAPTKVNEFCGDAICNNGENCSTCEVDCWACPEEAVCGDGVCSSSESCTSCPSDCGACPVTKPVCGNNVCDAGETSANCPSDCVKEAGAGGIGGNNLWLILGVLLAAAVAVGIFVVKSKMGKGKAGAVEPPKKL